MRAHVRARKPGAVPRYIGVVVGVGGGGPVGAGAGAGAGAGGGAGGGAIGGGGASMPGGGGAHAGTGGGTGRLRSGRIANITPPDTNQPLLSNRSL